MKTMTMNKHNDLDRIADLCLNHKTPKMQFDELADKIRVLQLEVQILNERLDQQENYKQAIESL